MIKYIIMNGLYAAALYYGIVEGIQGARNIAMVYTWLTIVFNWGTVSKDVRKALALNKKYPSVPYPIDPILDVSICAFLIWHGFIVTGSFYILQTILCIEAYKAVKQLRAKQTAPCSPLKDTP